jgi:hypothetical protein
MSLESSRGGSGEKITQAARHVDMSQRVRRKTVRNTRSSCTRNRSKDVDTIWEFAVSKTTVQILLRFEVWSRFLPLNFTIHLNIFQPTRTNFQHLSSTIQAVVGTEISMNKNKGPWRSRNGKRGFILVQVIHTR